MKCNRFITPSDAIRKKHLRFFFKHVFFAKKTWPPKKTLNFFFNTRLKEITS